MKARRYISKQLLQISLGLFIGLFVLTQTSYTSSSLVSKDTKEQSDDPINQNQQIKLTEAVPSASTHINVDFQSFLIEEVALNEDGEELKSPADQLISSVNRALKILLQRIISPNAP